jgi:hypothetical protein
MTVKVYGVNIVRPAIEQLVVAAVQLAPPGEAVAV